MKLLEGQLQKFFSIMVKWHNSSDGQYECSCWQGSKMVTEPKKTFYVLKFHSTESVTTAQWGFQRRFHKNAQCANSVCFLLLTLLNNWPDMGTISYLH
jgi:hypothetical protein